MHRGGNHVLTFIVGAALSLGAVEAYASLSFFPRDLAGDATAVTAIDLVWGNPPVAMDGGTNDSMLLLDTSGSGPGPVVDRHGSDLDLPKAGSSQGMENNSEAPSHSTGAGYGAALSANEMLRWDDLYSDFLSVGSRTTLPQGPCYRQFRPPRV